MTDFQRTGDTNGASGLVAKRRSDVAHVSDASRVIPDSLARSVDESARLWREKTKDERREETTKGRKSLNKSREREEGRRSMFCFYAVHLTLLQEWTSSESSFLASRIIGSMRRRPHHRLLRMSSLRAPPPPSRRRNGKRKDLQKLRVSKGIRSRGEKQKILMEVNVPSPILWRMN